MDFINDFPKVDGSSSIMVMIDFSKYAMFALTPDRSIPVEVAVDLFYWNVI